MDIIIHGICGRMGHSLIDNAPTHNINVVSGIDNKSTSINHIEVSDDISTIKNADVVIDFSAPDATLALLQEAQKTKTPLVIGTTGFSAAQETEITKAAAQIAIVKAGNMSLGINLLARLVEQAAQELSDWDIDIFEMHHSDKKDAPSGTALLLGEAAAAGRKIDFNPILDRSGVRQKDSIGFSVARGGSVIGEHEVCFLGTGERLTLAHSAEDRHIFARGALQAAKWVKTQKAGLYNLQDVLKDKKL